ncbi:MAG TPA: hypothetical protein PLO61_03415 [Fimbriimonadaceae bacterium]|nr:hypothetical protein [Fimbriimonadaceae bacterium]HRJ32680.1 hypothetical protein [Fimbriimonadaceae bacterium]
MKITLERMALRWKPHAGQEEFLVHPASIKILACGRRWGKTEATAALCASAWIERESSRQLLLAPTLDQARLLFERVMDWLRWLWPEAKIVERRSPYPHARWQGHTLLARSGHVGRALRGQEATDILIDEAAFLPESVITEIAMPMLATTQGKLVMLSTPAGMNHFWRFYQMGQRGEHGIWSRSAPSWESPYVRDSVLSVQKQLMSDRAYRVEYGAEFLESSGRVFRSELVHSSLVPQLEICENSPITIGIDFARYSDYTAVTILAGDRDRCSLIHCEQLQHLPWLEQLRKLSDLIRKYPGARVWCDATGVGDPVLEMLQSQGLSAHLEGCVFTPSFKQSMISSLVWLFERGALRMTAHPPLLRELEHFEADGRRLGAASGFHDDLVIALALAAHHLPQSYRPVIHLGENRTFSKSIAQGVA